MANLAELPRKISEHPRLARWGVNIVLILITYWATQAVTAWLAQPRLVEIMTMNPLEGGVAVRVQPVERRAIAQSVTYTGSVIPYYKADIHARLSGWVQEIEVDEGDYVQAGQFCCAIDQREIKARLREAEANLAFWKAEHWRMERLFAGDAVSEYDRDNARKQHEAARAKVDELRAFYSYTEIEAPFSGWVARRFVDPGDLVNPGQQLLRLVDLHRVRVQVQVAGQDWERIRVGTPAIIRFPALSEAHRRREARVTTVFPALDPAARTGTVEIVIDNPETSIQPHMYAVVDLVLAARSEALVVPRQAVVEREGQPVVFTTFGVDAQAVPVSLGLSDGKDVEIVEGLSEGQMVIVRGQQGLADGQQVNIVMF